MNVIYEIIFIWLMAVNCFTGASGHIDKRKRGYLCPISISVTTSSVKKISRVENISCM